MVIILIKEERKEIEIDILKRLVECDTKLSWLSDWISYSIFISLKYNTSTQLLRIISECYIITLNS